MKNKMKKTGYIIFLICFAVSIGLFCGLTGDFEIIKYWVTTSLILIFGHTGKTIIGETLKAKNGC